mmetsp:Transcript_7639/g.22375  ORF Transcript_7639/g.22375 Transcript_7639/m.22375 type:complete len:239 (+) Transcript_7639:524-1240(+)
MIPLLLLLADPPTRRFRRLLRVWTPIEIETQTQIQPPNRESPRTNSGSSASNKSRTASRSFPFHPFPPHGPRPSPARPPPVVVVVVVARSEPGGAPGDLARLQSHYHHRQQQQPPWNPLPRQRQQKPPPPLHHSFPSRTFPKPTSTGTLCSRNSRGSGRTLAPSASGRSRPPRNSGPPSSSSTRPGRPAGSEPSNRPRPSAASWPRSWDARFDRGGPSWKRSWPTNKKSRPTGSDRNP